MNDEDDGLPDGWQRIEQSDERAGQSGQYNAQRPIRYEHTDGIAVNVQPASPDVADAEGDVWRIGAVPDGGRDTVETLREDVEGRDAAIEVAREFMTTYNDHDGADAESAISTFRS